MLQYLKHLKLGLNFPFWQGNHLKHTARTTDQSLFMYYNGLVKVHTFIQINILVRLDFTSSLTELELFYKEERAKSVVAVVLQSVDSRITNPSQTLLFLLKNNNNKTNK